ncbi:dihydrofolate reductase family protein [Arthrobacter sp. DNA4]|uniref:dihydrofolate reductase family protein n=1 Tax=Micrococcaceae TaxID=1268 RepID=UPI0020CDAC34|nr:MULTISPECIES: dihydrofolate reductase family protein [Micrococcaceae]UTT70656.1 dihydrofolate reductase family protein [Arthrobacter sp. DNA4]WRT15072.1 dihydrofolate reductase family protein [Pseudarthrobacter sp. LT1]
MRKVTAGLFHSVDGVVSEPFKFQFDSFDEELGTGLARMINTVDTVILGRVSYQEWADYWPTAPQDQDFAAFINPVEKFVASHTLTGPLEWQNSRVMDAPLTEFVGALRERDGGEIAVCGSISVVRQLLFAGLLDSLQLMTHPVIAGSGRRLFEDGDPLTRLVLQDQSATSKGNVLSTYGVRARD